MTLDLLERLGVAEAPAPALPKFTLTPGQQTARLAYNIFLTDPHETVFVLSGYSGCGKSTLVRTLIDETPAILQAARTIRPETKDFQIELTATTNKAAENLAQISGLPVNTIHSTLGLRVQKDQKTGQSKLVPKNGEVLEGLILFIDEYSQIDHELLALIFSRTRKCKIVFVGDPAQLLGVKASGVPVQDAKFSGAALTEVVRQAEGNPIVDLSTKFRNQVNTGEQFQFKPDGHHVVHMNRNDFNAAIEREFTRADWKYSDSKVLAWTNRCVVGFNQYIRNLAKGDPHFQVGDYAVCNSFLQSGRQSLKTDELVRITGISNDSTVHGVLGNHITMNEMITAFQPKNLAEKIARVKAARAQGEVHVAADIENSWVDLRGAYACTINKSQGSTFGSVFIDLDDVGACTVPGTLARMLYVGVSRAKHHVYLTGDLA